MTGGSYTFTVDVIANIKTAQGALKELQNLFKNTKIQIPEKNMSQINNEMQNLDTVLTNLSKFEGVKMDSDQMRANLSSYKEIESILGRINSLTGGVLDKVGIKPEDFFPKEVVNTIKEATSAIEQYKKSASQKDTSNSKGVKRLEEDIEKERELLKQQEEAYNKALEAKNKFKSNEYKSAFGTKKALSKKDFSQLEEQFKQLEELEQAYKNIKRVTAGKRESTIGQLLGEDSTLSAASKNNLQALADLYTKVFNQDASGKTVQQINEEIAALKQKQNVLNQLKTMEADVATKKSVKEGTESDLKKKTDELTKLNEAIATTKAADFNALSQSLSKLGIDTTGAQNIQDLEQALAKFSSTASGEAKAAADTLRESLSSLNKTGGILKSDKGLLQNTFDIGQQQQRALYSMQYQLFDMFSIRGQIRVFKKAMSNAFNTIKELDSVMTETAVVTDFTIGDMWDKLPEYTNKANKLGTSIASLYEATTLYYQQGLNSDQAMSVGTETMKMARIANMEASEATQAMTAALRGFNMEINETSATRVNDVYSELAAITAADTEQIATAMTKTASIASSANMEFETTAAFLAQIIETTQEAPETAGTAMKTIIARFTEVKDLYSEGMLTGQDEEGEEININKIDKALQSVGISLKDFLLGKQGIDDIFLELASKWDTLDLATQRYIATTAAGSRQQSRFIAMMSNYGRTMELVNAAQESQGASQEQFDKTLDSMTAKLTTLNNAWDSFTMGIVNGEVAKGGVDILTKILNIVNKITEAFGGVGGAIAKVGVVLGGMRIGGSLIGKVFGTTGRFGDTGLGKMLRSASTLFKSTGTTPATPGQIPVTSGWGQLPQMGSRMGRMMISPFQRFTGGSEYKEALKSYKAYKNATKAQEKYNKAIGTSRAKKLMERRDKLAEKVPNAKKLQEDEKILKENAAIREQMTSAGITLAGAALAVGGDLAADAFKKKYEQTGDTASKAAGEGLEVVSKFGTGITVANMGLSMLGTNLLNVLGPYGLAATAVIGLGTAIIKGVRAYNETLTQQYAYEQAQKMEAEASNRVELQKAEYKSSSEFTESLQDKYREIDKLADGSVAQNQAKAALNAEIANQISNNPDLANFFSMTDGVLKLVNRAGLENLVQAEQQEVFQAEQEEIVAKQQTYSAEVSVKKQLLGEDLFNYTGKHGLAQMAITLGWKSIDYEEILEKVASAYEQGLITDKETLRNFLLDEYGESEITPWGADAYEVDTVRLAGSWEELEAALMQNAAIDAGEEARKYATAQQLHSNYVQSGQLKDAEAEKVSNLDSELIVNFYDKAFSEAENLAKDLWTSQKEEALRQYAELTEGVVYADGKLYDEKTGERLKDLEANEALIVDALTNSLANQEYKKSLDKYLDIFDNFGNNLEQAEMFAGLLSEAGSSLTQEQLDTIRSAYITKDATEVVSKTGTETPDDKTDDFKLLVTGNELDLGKMAKDLHFDSAEAWAKELDLTVGELGEMIMDNINSALERDLENKFRLAGKQDLYSDLNIDPTKDILKQANWDQIYENLGEDFYNAFMNIESYLQGAGDNSLTTAGMQFIAELGKEGNLKGIEKIEDFVSGINFKNPIKAVKTLRREAERGTGATKDFAQQLLEVNSVQLGTGAQLRYLLSSSDFEEIQKNLDDILETNGQITAANVLELAEEYSSLGDILDQTQISAEGLATALEMVGEGKLNISQLTDGVVASLGAMDSINGLIAETLKTISEFDFGVDENQAVEFINKTYETLKKNIESGAYGNAQNYNILDFLFGEDWAKEGLSREEIKEEMKFYMDFLGRNVENMGDAWKQLASGQNIRGQQVGKKNADGSYTISGKEGSLVLGIDSKTGGILFDGYQNKTSEQMASIVAEAYGVSLEMASLMLTDFKQQAPEMAAALEKNDFDAGMALAKEGQTKQFGENALWDMSEIEALAQIWGKETTDVMTALGLNKDQISNFYNADGSLKNIADVSAELNRLAEVSTKVKGKSWLDQSGGTWIDPHYLGRDEGYNFEFDSTSAHQQLSAMGFDESTQDAIIQQQIDDLFANNQDLEQVVSEYQTKTGEWVDLVLQEGESYATAKHRADVEAEGAIYAEQMAAAFSEIEITMVANNDQLVAAQEALAVLQDSAGETIDFTVTGDHTAVNNAIAAVDELRANLAAGGFNFTVEGGLSGPTTFTVTGSASGSISIAAAAGGLVNSPTTHESLLGEEGPELVQTKNGAWIAGLNGPEVGIIHKGDTVYTAEETKQIFNPKQKATMPRFQDGLGDNPILGYDDAPSGGKGSGAKGKDEVENPFDKLYNLLRKIDEELRERERIQRRYEKLLEDIGISADKIINISREELAQLEKERQYQEELVANRRYQIDAYQQENSDLLQYASVTQNERGEDVLRIDWDLINTVNDKEKMSDIQEYVTQLEKWFDSLTEAEDSLWDIEDAIEEIKERGEDEYFDLEEAVKDALEQSYQDQIDKLEDINDAINDTNAELLEGIQKTINKQRQDRENEKTEEDLADKQRRLSYLQMDTSGANATEILKLQKEIEEGQENYTDTLIDQKISELQEQNDEAAKQREKQIDLLQAQLDHYLETGRIWEQVNKLMATGVDSVNGLIPGSELEQLLQNEAGFQGMSAIGKMEWMNETNNMIAQALAYLELGRQLEDIGVKAGTKIEFVTADGQTLTGTVDKDGVVTTADGKKYDNVYQTYDGTFRAGENIAPVEAEEVEGVDKDASGSGSGSGSGTGSGSGNYTSYTVTGLFGIQYTGWGLTTEDARTKAEEMRRDAESKFYKATDQIGNTYWGKTQAEAQEKAAAANERLNKKGYGGYFSGSPATYSHFATGGLADFTGPAWLDGTKARPELVLNQRDTQNFIQLKDILSSLFSHNLGNSTSTENNGDITYDIDINVESIGSDYDVDKVASRVKTLITEDARYRNNNAVSLKR